MSIITVYLALYTYKQNTLDDNVYFFIIYFDSHFILDYLILIENQLILIS
jgi:hypothetical protein